MMSFDEILRHAGRLDGRPATYRDGFEYDEKVRLVIYETPGYTVAGHKVSPALRWALATEDGYTGGIV